MELIDFQIVRVQMIPNQYNIFFVVYEQVVCRKRSLILHIKSIKLNKGKEMELKL